MKRKTNIQRAFFFVFVLLFTGMCLVVCAEGKKSKIDDKIKFPFKGEGVGYVLLNKVITPVKPDASKPRKSIHEMSNQIFTELVKARSLGKIDEEFYQRFKHALGVVSINAARRLIGEKDLWLDEHLREMINQIPSRKEKIEAGAQFDIEETIGEAITDELISLKNYLDKTTSKKDQ